MRTILGVQRTYDWGSQAAIPDFLGFESDSPVAEVWFGTHATGTSPLADGDGDLGDLGDLIRADPRGALGERVAADHDGLPYLLKLLAPGRPVSLQVHPSPAAARDGFAREELEGVPIDAPNRSFKDDQHKPEMVYALTPFDGLVGFRPVPELLEVLSSFAHPFLQTVVAGLGAAPDAAALKRSVEQLARTSRENVESIFAEAGEPAATSSNAVIDARATLRELAATYPGDAGIVVSLLLRRFHLAPGEAVFVPSGAPHAYLSGLAVEIMASSDNVLRAGLTTKHVDVDALVSVIDVRPVEQTAVRRLSPQFSTIDPGAREFALTVMEPGGGELTWNADGPRIVLAVRGDLVLSAAGQSLQLSRGTAVFVADSDGPLTIRGTGSAVAASVPTGSSPTPSGSSR